MDQFYRMQASERHADFHREASNDRLAKIARRVRRQAVEADPKGRLIRAKIRLLPRVALLLVRHGS